MCNTVLSGESRRASSSVWRHFSNCPPVYCSFARLISTVARALFHLLIATSFWVGSFGPVDWHPAATSNVIRPVARERRFKRMIRLHAFGDIPLGLFPGPRQEHFGSAAAALHVASRRVASGSQSFVAVVTTPDRARWRRRERMERAAAVPSFYSSCDGAG